MKKNKKVAQVLIDYSEAKDKKYSAILQNDQGKKIRTVNFGAKGYSDYTIHKDHDRMLRYK